MLKILITEPKGYSKKAIEILKSIGKVIFLNKKEEFEKDLPDIDILVIKLGFQINSSIIDKAHKLKLIATSTTGLNHINVDYAASKGIKVLSLRGETDFLKNIPSTAEHTFALILALIRKIPWAFDSVKKEKWERENYFGNEIFGKTLGILGYGRLGKIVAKYAQCFGLHILAHDPYVPSKKLVKDVIPKSFENLFRESDIISVHVLLTPETENLVKEKHFKMMKPTSIFINTSRGEIIDENALLKALKEKWIFGAAIDVMKDEKPDGSHLINNPLLEYVRNHNNLIIIPHLGGATYEAMQKTEEFLSKKIKEYGLLVK